jgi:hypothetical protein
MPKNYLKAVFWDYPELSDPDALARVLKEARRENDSQKLRWLMGRFLERGRIKDTALYFRPKEIRANLGSMRISQRARKRWERLLEVYGNID